MGLSCGKAGFRHELAQERERIVPAIRLAAAQLQERLADLDGSP